MSCTLILVRHGRAEPACESNDAARLLTGLGKQELVASCAGLARLALPITRIWSSPLVRARQTAEILRTELGVGSLVEIASGLASGSSAEDMLSVVSGIREGVHVLVAHMPDLAQFGHRLLAPNERAVNHFEPGAMACLDFATVVAFGRARLRWHYAPRDLAELDAHRS